MTSNWIEDKSLSHQSLCNFLINLSTEIWTLALAFGNADVPRLQIREKFTNLYYAFLP